MKNRRGDGREGERVFNSDIVVDVKEENNKVYDQ